MPQGAQEPQERRIQTELYYKDLDRSDYIDDTDMPVSIFKARVVLPLVGVNRWPKLSLEYRLSRPGIEECWTRVL
jgi:hypothetical protein